MSSGAIESSAQLLIGYGVVAGLACWTLRARKSPLRMIAVVPAWALVGTAGAAIAGGATVAAIGAVAHLSDGGVVRVVAMLAWLAFAGILVGHRLSRRLTFDRVKRGTALACGAPGSAHAEEGVTHFAGLPLTLADETKHFKLLGTTGTGKSTAIRALLAPALARGDRAVFSDPDGGYLRGFYDPARGDVILNPFDARARSWDLMSELRAPYDYDQLARSLLGEGSGAEESWRDYAQILLSCLLARVRRAPESSVRELYRVLTAAPLEELRILLDGSPAQPFLEPGNERMFGSVRAVLTARTAALSYVGQQLGAPFSIRDWVADGRGVLFLPYAADQIASLHALVSTWLRTAIFQTMSQGEGDHRIWFVIDELDALGAIDGLKDALARLRKFGGRCVLGFQSIAQVSALYGNSDAQTIVENCGNTLILRCSASEQGGTARFASRLIGEREILRESVSANRPTGLFGRGRGSSTSSLQHVIETAVLPSEIEQLPDLRGFAKLASQPAWVNVSLRP